MTKLRIYQETWSLTSDRHQNSQILCPGSKRRSLFSVSQGKPHSFHVIGATDRGLTITNRTSRLALWNCLFRLTMAKDISLAYNKLHQHGVLEPVSAVKAHATTFKVHLSRPYPSCSDSEPNGGSGNVNSKNGAEPMKRRHI